MKSTIVAAIPLLFASAVFAQTACDSVAAAISTCGVPCISSVASVIGCSNSDYGCRCSNSAVIQSSAQACVLNNCGFLDALQVQASASAVCACVATAAPNATPAPVAMRPRGRYAVLTKA